MPLTRDDLKQVGQLLREDLELRLELAEQILDEYIVALLMERNPRLREIFRRAVLTEALLQLPEQFQQFRAETEAQFANIRARFERVEGRLQEFYEATEARFEKVEGQLQQFRTETEARFEKVEGQLQQFRAETEARFEKVEGQLQQFRAETEARFEKVETRLTNLERDVAETKQGVRNLQDWQRGEMGRRAGEDYERTIVRRAARIFGVGEGGSPAISERVNQQIVQWLTQAGLLDEDVPEDSDPLDADLVWWKGNRVAVAEISIKVDKDDVLRAKRRAEVLRRAGLEVLPVVIGSEWAHPETEQIAAQEGVAWRVGNAVSDAIVRFRALTAP